MKWRIFFLGLGLLVTGFALNLYGASVGPSPGLAAAPSLRQQFLYYMNEAWKQLFTSMGQALNGDGLGNRLEGIGSVLAYLGLVLIVISLFSLLLPKRGS